MEQGIGLVYRLIEIFYSRLVTSMEPLNSCEWPILCLENDDSSFLKCVTVLSTQTCWFSSMEINKYCGYLIENGSVSTDFLIDVVITYRLLCIKRENFSLFNSVNLEKHLIKCSSWHNPQTVYSMAGPARAHTAHGAHWLTQLHCCKTPELRGGVVFTHGKSRHSAPLILNPHQKIMSSLWLHGLSSVLLAHEVEIVGSRRYWYGNKTSSGLLFKEKGRCFLSAINSWIMGNL